MSETIQPQSLVTLHYRISLSDGALLISTFESTPTTLQLGKGELLPSLEQMLLGLETGTHTFFDLTPEQAFGPRREELVERVDRKDVPEDVTEIPSIMEFTAPNGARYSGVLTEMDEVSARVDFNHPLAGKAIRFEVKIIGVL